jgi:glycosyltransferase involved in cell wall biosynthesis
MEAMSFGIPVISTHTGAIPELLNEGAGVMCQEKNPKALADAISYIIGNPDFVQALRIKGYARIKDDFNVEKSVNQLIALMQN